MIVVTRFAPSPTGYLHLGHAYSALYASHTAADAGAGGRFLVRIEDIDTGRCRPEFETAIQEDLAWLGLEWEVPVRRQSDHMDDYADALARLDGMGLVYPCFCSRAEIQAEIEAAGGAPHGADGPLYPGTCRELDSDERTARIDTGAAYALRLDAGLASSQTGPLSWTDEKQGEFQADTAAHGDVVLARKDVATSYHLSVTVDDHLQGVNLVTRGEDLFTAGHVQRLLQALLGLDVPRYHHHRLITGEDGRRLAKRDSAATIRSLREAGHDAAAVIAMIESRY